MDHRTFEPGELPTDPRYERRRATPSPGPSDSSDSGSDLVGVPHSDDTSDRNGTGERVDVENDVADSDIELNRIVRASEAGLGGGLDQAEEAQLGITDEEIDELEERED